MTTAFADATIDDVDTSPPLDDVEFPCKVCGREAGPYGGRGPKPKLCAEHKTVKSSSTRTPRVTGNAANLAVQASCVLVQLNGIITIGLMAVGMRETASAMAACSDNFQQQAYEALLTDPELCKALLRGGVQSAKVSLGLAYVGMATVVVPTAVAEAKEKKEARMARMSEEQDI